jgi:uncharacterized protein involved in exopolysaccharide biosynthesis
VSRTLATPPYETSFGKAYETAETAPVSTRVWLVETLRRWRIITATVLVSLLLAIAAIIFLPSVYRSQASFVATSSSPRLPGNLGSTSGLAGMAAQFGIAPGTDPSESPAFYAQLIESRELLTRLLNTSFADPRTSLPTDSAKLLDLLKIRRRDTVRKREIARKELDDDIKVAFDTKTNLVTVTVDAEWPELASAVANRTLDYVNEFNLEQRMSRARAKRVVVEARQSEAERDLGVAEANLRAFYERNRQWQLSPALVYEEGALRRRADLAADLYTSLRREFENARIAEVNDAPLITVVDRAIPARKAQWPRIGLTLLSALVVGGLIGTLIAGTAYLVADWSTRNPYTVAEVREIAADFARSPVIRLLPRRFRGASRSRNG